MTTTEDRAKIAAAVADYRRAAQNIRRNDASNYQMQRNQRVVDAHARNGHVMVSAVMMLQGMGLRHVANALHTAHERLQDIACARDEGRMRDVEHLSAELRDAQRVIREALRPTGGRVTDRHDYEPGDTTHPMASDPDCRVCGETRDTCEGR